MNIKMYSNILFIVLLLQSTVIAIYDIAAQSISQETDSTLANLRGSLVQLNWAEHEVEEITKIMHGTSYIRQQATEQRFKQEAGKAKIIHLATHANTDDENPMYSNFVFVPDTSAGEDGFLNTYELYNMQLNADLVVLSGCNTGYGKLYRGEGVMSLARGFMYAGCPRIVMSLWSVDDQSSAKIMNIFYKNLADGLTINDALRQAKLTYLRTTDKIKSNPFYWAGFVSIGETAPLILNSGLN
ncbi:MAG: CHAT domain-containing protein, partial [Gammaproteobacteria bacterium]|nr:CHAT domain-containing protein [Gammaproteobacteria bacterium]